jgi:hypothetical protein
MKRLGYPITTASAALLLPAPAPLLAAAPAAQADAGAIVLRPLSLLKKTNMDFGTLATSPVAGTATINAVTGAVTTTGGVTALPIGTAPSAAAFVGAGSRNAPYQIRIPKVPVTLTRVGGTETMTVTNWTLDGPSNRKVGVNQAFEFHVGGQLIVAANQAGGTYVGTFDVTVHYP